MDSVPLNNTAFFEDIRLKSTSAPRAEQAAPPLEAQQAPDQQPVVRPPRDVVFEGPLDISPLDERQQEAILGEQHLPNVVHQVDPVPGLIRGAEALLAFFQDQLGQRPLHGLAENVFAGHVLIGVPGVVDQVSPGDPLIYDIGF